MLEAHPYEEPAYDVVELAALDEPDRGSGRIGRLPSPMTLREFAAHVVRRCWPRPRTASASRATRTSCVETVGLCGGAGDFLLDRARAAGVDVYLTSDLRHHPASELREHGERPALVDVAHWAAESTWLPVLRDRLVAALGEDGRYGGGARQHDQHRPVDLPGLSPDLDQETVLKADPFVQLKLLDVQELDSRIDTLTHQLSSIPEAAQLRELTARRKTLDNALRDLRVAGRRHHRRAEARRRRRRAGQDPPGARPGR